MECGWPTHAECWSLICLSIELVTHLQVLQANRDVTRMEIFMSLVHLLDQTVKGGASTTNETDNNNMMVYHSFPQTAQIAASGRPA